MNKSILVGAGLVVSAYIADVALTCGFPVAPMPPIEVSPLPGGRARVRVTNYQTFGSGPGQTCGCALTCPPGGAIASVDTASWVDAGTNNSLGFNFSQNATTTAGFDAATGSTTQGFAAASPGVVAAGQNVDLSFTVTLAPGANLGSLQAELTNTGVIGSDEVTAGGMLTGNHLHLESAGPVTVIGIIPTMSEWQLIVMGILLLTAGTLVVRQRAPRLALAGAGESQTSPGAPAFERGLFVQTLALTGVVALAGLGLAFASYGTVSGVDVGGACVSAVALAYLLHLWRMKPAQ